MDQIIERGFLAPKEYIGLHGADIHVYAYVERLSSNDIDGANDDT